MKPILGHVVSLLAAGLVVSAVMPACATNDQTVFIRSVLAPPTTRTAGICAYMPDPEALFLPTGVLDVGITDSYVAFILVGNQLVPRGDPANNRSESNRVHFNGGVVRVTETDGTSLINEFTSFSTGFADPQSATAAQYAIVGLTVVDARTAQLIGDAIPNKSVTKTVIVNIKVFGTSLGGTDVESGEFPFPIQVCKGCLVDFSTGNDPLGAVVPNCNNPLPPAGGTTVLPCRKGQDEATPCQLCKGRPICDNPALP